MRYEFNPMLSARLPLFEDESEVDILTPQQDLLLSFEAKAKHDLEQLQADGYFYHEGRKIVLEGKYRLLLNDLKSKRNIISPPTDLQQKIVVLWSKFDTSVRYNILKEIDLLDALFISRTYIAEVPPPSAPQRSFLQVRGPFSQQHDLYAYNSLHTQSRPGFTASSPSAPEFYPSML